MRKKIVLSLAICASVCLTVLAVAVSRPDLQNIGIGPQILLNSNEAEIIEEAFKAVDEGNANILLELQQKKDETVTENKEETIAVEKRYVSDVSFNSLPEDESVKEEKVIFDTNNVSGDEEKYSDALTSGIKYFFSEIGKGVNDVKIYLLDTDNESIKELYATYVTDEGEAKDFASGVYYDEEKQLLYGKDDKGIFALGFDYDIGQHIGYTPTDAWQRDYGFCLAYDIIANTTKIMEYDTERFKFEYNDMDWMIQIWKGKYVFATGAEIGLYNKPKDRIEEFYDVVTDEYLMEMSMVLRAKEDGHALFERELQYHWWLTGFDMQESYTADELILEGEIVFPNQEMLDAFISVADKNKDFDYTVDGLKISYTW